MTPHAVEQFQLRVAPEPAGRAIEIVQAALQELVLVEFNVARAQYRGRAYYPVIGPPPDPPERPWPVVVTVLGDDSPLHAKVLRGEKDVLRVPDQP